MFIRLQKEIVTFFEQAFLSKLWITYAITLDLQACKKLELTGREKTDTDGMHFDLTQKFSPMKPFTIFRHILSCKRSVSLHNLLLHITCFTTVR